MDAVAVAGVVGAISAIGVLIDSAELLVIRAQLGSGGIYDWHVLRTTQPSFDHLPSARLFDRIFAYPHVLALPVVQIIAAATLVTIPVVGGPGAVGAVAAGVILAARMLLYARNQYGQDGSDQMILVVMWACSSPRPPTITRWPPSPWPTWPVSCCCRTWSPGRPRRSRRSGAAATR